MLWFGLELVWMVYQQESPTEKRKIPPSLCVNPPDVLTSPFRGRNKSDIMISKKTAILEIYHLYYPVWPQSNQQIGLISVLSFALWAQMFLSLRCFYHAFCYSIKKSKQYTEWKWVLLSARITSICACMATLLMNLLGDDSNGRESGWLFSLYRSTSLIGFRSKDRRFDKGAEMTVLQHECSKKH